MKAHIFSISVMATAAAAAAAEEATILSLPNEILYYILADRLTTGFRSNDALLGLSLLFPLRAVCKKFAALAEKHKIFVAARLRASYKCPTSNMRIMIRWVDVVVTYAQLLPQSQGFIQTCLPKISTLECLGYIKSKVTYEKAQGAMVLAKHCISPNSWVTPQATSASTSASENYTELVGGYFDEQVLVCAASSGSVEYFDFIYQNLRPDSASNVKWHIYQEELLFAAVSAVPETAALSMLHHIVNHRKIVESGYLETTLNLNHRSSTLLCTIIGQLRYFQVFRFFKMNNYLECYCSISSGNVIDTAPFCICTTVLSAAFEAADDVEFFEQIHDLLGAELDQIFCYCDGPVYKNCLSNSSTCKNKIIRKIIQFDRFQVLHTLLTKYRWELTSYAFYFSIGCKSYQCLNILINHPSTCDVLKNIEAKKLHAFKCDSAILLLLLDRCPDLVESGLALQILGCMIDGLHKGDTTQEEIHSFIFKTMKQMYDLNLLPPSVVSLHRLAIQQKLKLLHPDLQSDIRGLLRHSFYLIEYILEEGLIDEEVNTTATTNTSLVSKRKCQQLYE